MLKLLLFFALSVASAPQTLANPEAEDHPSFGSGGRGGGSEVGNGNGDECLKDFHQTTRRLFSSLESDTPSAEQSRFTLPKGDFLSFLTNAQVYADHTTSAADFSILVDDLKLIVICKLWMNQPQDREHKMRAALAAYEDAYFNSLW